MEGDIAAAMVAGIDRYLTQETATVKERRVTSVGNASSAELRNKLSAILGLMDERTGASFQIDASADGGTEVAKGDDYKIFEVSWPALDGVDGEGLLLIPDSDVRANVIVLPDCDLIPEQVTGLRDGETGWTRVVQSLVQCGCQVLVPVLMDRRCTHSGNPDIAMTNQPHREFIYRAAYQMGRHVIGYEIQKVLAAVDAFEDNGLPTGVFGHGEGGLLAFYSAALDERIDSTAVSGFFQPREDLWSQPIYRNLFGLLNDFGDAEVASLISPRTLVVENADHPKVSAPPVCEDVRQSGAPGKLSTPSVASVQEEFLRASEINPDSDGFGLTLSPSGHPGAEATLWAFVEGLGLAWSGSEEVSIPSVSHEGVCPEVRFKRQFDQLVEHTQRSLREAEKRRESYWAEAKGDGPVCSGEAERYRSRLWEDVIGALPPVDMAPNPRSRLLFDAPKLTAYEVVLDVYGDVFAYGILLIPKRIRKGDRRPLVVCQHGLEGRPQDVVGPDGPRHPYKNFAYELANEGFITFAPQNPYIGKDDFRVLQRKANPLKLSLFSFIVRQHEQTLAWLATLPFVDPERMAFYGLSYGGKTAMRVPALVKQYCLSICSADYNEWIRKNVTVDHRCTYMFSGEYEMPEFNLGNTFNYAEMSWLICPRPFMVERGHHDGCAPDEWVAYEYAKTYRHYALQGLGDRTAIEYFDGPHTINGEGSYAFLRKHLSWKRCGWA